MAELSIDPDYLRHLIVKVRSFMAKSPMKAQTRSMTRCRSAPCRMRKTISAAKR
jgi:hypothetical protein